jgi:hypothetical protein
MSVPETVGDLEATDVVVYTARSGGTAAHVHLRPNDCPRLDRSTNTLRADRARDVFNDWEVCQHCVPDPDDDGESGSESESESGSEPTPTNPETGQPQCQECGVFLPAGETTADCDHPPHSDGSTPMCPACGMFMDGGATACPRETCDWTAGPKRVLEIEGALYENSSRTPKNLHCDEECEHLKNAKGEPDPVQTPGEIPLRAELCSYCFGSDVGGTVRDAL